MEKLADAVRARGLHEGEHGEDGEEREGDTDGGAIRDLERGLQREDGREEAELSSVRSVSFSTIPPVAFWLPAELLYTGVGLLSGAIRKAERGMDDIAANLERVNSHIAEAAAKSGRAVADIQLIAVSKKQDAEKVRAAFDAGQTLFGESRVQEARAKIPLLPSAAALAFHRAPAEEQDSPRASALRIVSWHRFARARAGHAADRGRGRACSRASCWR